MPSMVQYNRDYSLYIGYGPGAEGILVKGLHIEFDIEKVINNQQKLNEAQIKVYNLSRTQTTALQEHEVSVRLLVGYKNTSLVELCLGNAVKVQTEKSGSDWVTTITVGEAYSLVNNRLPINTIPGGKTVADVIKQIASDGGLTIGGIYGDKANTTLAWGYPIEGTVRQQLSELTAAYSLEYFINGNVLTVRDSGGYVKQNKSQAVILNEDTGLLDVPYFESWNEGKKKKTKKEYRGVVVKALLNPTVIPGKLINIQRPTEQEGEIKNGYYLVRQAKYSGGYDSSEWCMELKCDEVLLGDYPNG